jgi:gamma-glutamyltranspeptidase/glutathione hydrolase
VPRAIGAFSLTAKKELATEGRSRENVKLRHVDVGSPPRASVSAMGSSEAPPTAEAWRASATTMDFKSRRTCALGTNGMVACSQSLATAAGLEILRKGGTAADAAVAVTAALNVCEPTSTGIGGDAFCLYFDAATKKVSAVRGGGRSPAGLTLDLVRSRGHSGLEISPSTDALCAVVPGAAAAWEDVVNRFGSGKLSLGEILQPAIELAETGPPIGAVTAQLWAAQEGLLQKQGASCMLNENGRAPKAGERKPNRELANTFRLLAKHGAQKGFYEGPVADAIVQAVRSRGGVLTKDDLKAHRTTFPTPIATTFRNKVTVWELPPPNHGVAALEAINIFEKFYSGSEEESSESHGAGENRTSKQSKADEEETRRAHAAIEAMRLAFADAMEHCGDPDFVDATDTTSSRVSTETLCSKAFALARARTSGFSKHGPPLPGPEPSHPGHLVRQSPDTVYFAVVDKHGNACSFINSNYDGFGLGIAPEGCGFTLQNRGHNFILSEGHVNCLGPNKRPYHTIIPGLATRVDDNALFCVFGVMGGFMQPQGHLQVLSNMLDKGMDPQSALDFPRWCLKGIGSERGSGSVLDAEVAVEQRGCCGDQNDTSDTSARTERGKRGKWALANALQQMGHKVVRVDETLGRTLFGRGQIIARDDSGVLWGGTDPRGDGCAMGL